MASPRALALALLLALAPLAGCLTGASDDETPATVEEPATNQTAPNATLPDGRGESAGLKEVNKTEEGVGGMEHLHDYWAGRETVIVFDRTVGLAAFPLYPDGEGSQPSASAYLKLPRGPESEPNLVFEGTEKVTFLAGTPETWSDTAHPSPPKLFMQYRSAADSEWTDKQEVAYGTPAEIAVTPQMTDMPHSTSSLWVFRLTTDRADDYSVPITISIHKGRDVVDWPGHPEFYANGPARVVLDQHVTTHMSGLESALLYDSGGTWVNPEKLISWGTTRLHVFLNITKVSNAYNADGTGFFLEVHNATIIGPEITFGSRHFDEDEPDDLKSWDFIVEVDEDGMDGPYQPSSRWGFRAMATFAEIPGVTGLCPGCFPYDIEYDIKVVAISDPE